MFIVCSACGDAQPVAAPFTSLPPSTAAPAPSPAGVLVPASCGAGDCRPGFVLDGETWWVHCDEIKPAAVTDVSVGVGPPEFAEARELVGLDARHVLAARANTCSASDWHLAINVSHDLYGRDQVITQARAWCDALVAPEPQFGCDTGGSARWYEGDVVRFAYFDEHVASIEAATDDDGRRALRLDPTAVAARHVEESYSGICTADWKCRLLGAEAIIDGDSASMRALIQSHIPNSGYDTTRLDVTLERLVPGGATWWVTAVQESTDPFLGDGEDARRTWNKAAECCDIVIFEPLPGSTLGTTPEP